MNTPLIGITTNQDSVHFATAYNTLSAAYVKAVRDAGGMPVLLPNEFPLDRLSDLRSRLDGIIFSGGGDVETSLFNGVDNDAVSGVSKDRDKLEISLVHLAVETDWPFLGICRGIQVINVALGGDLYTHIPDQFKSSIRHATPASLGRDHIAHQVTTRNGTVLSQILQMETLPVNSFHHQAIQNPAPALTVCAHAEDGLIEGVELASHRFGVGVQWHPECIQNHPEQRRLFTAFIQATRV